MKTLVIVPAFNEEETICGVIDKVQSLFRPFDILVVDDASTDNTYDLAKSRGAKVVRHVLNRGAGAALRTGYNVAIREGYDYIVQLDADSQHDPRSIPKLLNMSIEDDYGLVIGSRYLENKVLKYKYEDPNWIRKIGNRFFSQVASFLSQSCLSDITSGFRVIKVSNLGQMNVFPDKHWALEQTLEGYRKGLKIKEVPVKMNERKKGSSQFNIQTYLRYPFRMVESILKVYLLA